MNYFRTIHRFACTDKQRPTIQETSTPAFFIYCYLEAKEGSTSFQEILDSGINFNSATVAKGLHPLQELINKGYVVRAEL